MNDEYEERNADFSPYVLVDYMFDALGVPTNKIGITLEGLSGKTASLEGRTTKLGGSFRDDTAEIVEALEEFDL